MTLAFVSTGSIPLLLRHGLPPFAPEVLDPPKGFAVLLAARATLGAGSGARPTNGSAPVATAFDQGRLFGTAVATADPVQEDVPHLSADASAALSANRTSSDAMTPGVVQSRAKPAIGNVQTAPLSELSDVISVPPEMPKNATRSDHGSDLAPKVIGRRSLIFSRIGGPAFTVVAPAPAETLPRRTNLLVAPTAPPSPRKGLASERAAMIGRLGPVYVSIQSNETVTHILARIAGVRSDWMRR